MVNILIMKIIFKINVFTYIFLILSMLAGYFREMFIVFIILIVHELGHFFLMKLMGIKVDSITIYPYGGIIKSNMLINTNSLKVIVISLGGVINQLFLWMVVYIFFKVCFINSYYYGIFLKYNLYIILFNLMPIYPLDGFKILNNFFELFISFRKSMYLSFFINVFGLIIFFIYLYIYKVSNYIIVIFLIVSLVNYIREIKYIMNKFYVERIIYDLKYNGIVSVKNKNSMFKNKLNYIDGINEKSYLVNSYSVYY